MAEISEPTSAKRIGVSEFKRRCLELLETLRRKGEALVITKRGEPIALVTPYRRPAGRLRGLMRDRLRIRGEIVEVDWTDEWEAAR